MTIRTIPGQGDIAQYEIPLPPDSQIIPLLEVRLMCSGFRPPPEEGDKDIAPPKDPF